MNNIRFNDQSAVQGIAGRNDRVNKRISTFGRLRLGVSILLLGGAFIFSNVAEAQVRKPATTVNTSTAKKENVKPLSPAQRKALSEIKVNRITRPDVDTSYPDKVNNNGKDPYSGESTSSSSTTSLPPEVYNKRNEIKKFRADILTKQVRYETYETAVKYNTGSVRAATLDEIQSLFNGVVVAKGRYKGRAGWFIAACEEDLQEALKLASENKNISDTHLFLPALGYNEGSSTKGRDNTGFFYTGTKKGNTYYYFHFEVNDARYRVKYIDIDPTTLGYPWDFCFPVVPISK